jgi:antitoxin component of RelBE/YafQ-DinJ toxin-antitoxin module
MSHPTKFLPIHDAMRRASKQWIAAGTFCIAVDGEFLCMLYVLRVINRRFVVNDSLVSARIAPAKKAAGAQALAALGATASDLINAAYDYVLAEKQLPSPSKRTKPLQEDFAAFVAASTLHVSWGDGAKDGDYKSLAREMRVRDYESLA